MMGFKEDAVFARYLSIGVYAADAVTKDLERHGHRVVELERYAKANKVWQTKVKRMRLPDLLCVSCGRRIESKGKSKLEIKLSDSDAPDRAWRDGGMRLDDIFAFAQVDIDADPVSVASIVYVTRASLERALGSSKEGNRKAISEGSELDRTWPMWAPSRAGRVLDVEITDSKRTVRVEYDNGRRGSHWHGRNWRTFHSLNAGESFSSGQPVASSFEPLSSIECPGEVWDWQSDLRSEDDDMRFPAVKAARYLSTSQAEPLLLALASDEQSDWRIRLEAHASLAPYRVESVASLVENVMAPDASDECRMEAVFALSEVDTLEAARSLAEVASAGDTAPPDEVRAAAAWGLGTGARPSPDLLVNLLRDDSVLVATHAAAVLPAKLPRSIVDELSAWLTGEDLHAAATAAHLFAERGLVLELASALGSAPDEARRLAVLALGDVSHENVEPLVANIDAESRAGLATLWARRNDWLRQPDTDGALSALHQQMLRL